MEQKMYPFPDPLQKVLVLTELTEQFDAVLSISLLELVPGQSQAYIYLFKVSE